MFPTTPHPSATELEKSWQGDEIPLDKDNTTDTRIMFHNVNGLTLKGTEGFDVFLNEQALLHVDIQAISEHCLDTTQFRVLTTANEIARKCVKHRYALQLDSSSEPALHQYKPGGTGMVLLGPVTSRLEPQGRGGDLMGRWSYAHFRRKQLPPITIISAYQVCPRPTNLIGNTAYHQQQRILHRMGRTETHPRTSFIHDLNDFISDLQQKHHDILLGGDFNEALTDRNSGIHQLATMRGLIDPFLTRFPHHVPFGTHSQGNRRIDIVLMTPRLMRSLKKIGYAPFNHSISSDHRPILLDFHTATLFGELPDLLQPSQSRAFQTKDKKAVKSFIETMYQEIHRKGGFQHKRSIEDNTATPEIIELVDSIIGESGDVAERKCRRRRSEYYSSPLVQQRLRVSILRAHLNALKQGRDRTIPLKVRMARLGLQIDLPATQRLTALSLRGARSHLQELTQEHSNLRSQELTTKMEQAAAQGEKQRAQALRAIKKVEMGRETYRILKAMRKKQGDAHNIDRLEIPASWPHPSTAPPPQTSLEDPKSCQLWRTVTNPDEIEFYLMTRNRLHFGQAEGTPFTVSPLRESIDWLASSSASEEILRGQYETTTTNHLCNDLLTACRAVTALDSLPPELTMHDFAGKIKTWRETTTTSPSGRHLGRYKALFTNGMTEFEPECEGNESLSVKQRAIAELQLSVINFCIRQNYVLERWKTIVNVMIFKEPMNYKIHRLRVIHIYEADFNLILAVKWRQLLRFADAASFINKGQYGGRPGCEAQSLTLLEELKYDLSYLTRRSLFNFDNDATSCYDRILVPLASLINRKYGIHHQVVAIHAKTLQQARFRLKTATGVSQLTYSHCDQYPIHGTGQGSGNSPSIWLFISSTLFDVHAQAAQGVTFVSPDGKTSVKMSMIGFVDDSTGSCNDFRPGDQASLSELFHKMEHDAQLWNNLLYCSGGKLELPKCSFHVLHFDYRPDGRPLPTLERFDDKIHIIDQDTKRSIPIRAKRAFETHKTLGHLKSPYSATRATLQVLEERANHLALLISLSPISRQGAYLAYRTVFLPTVKYTLPQSFYPKRFLDHAQAKSLGKIIAKCGYNRHTARAVIFAPAQYAGGGFVPWFVLQGEGQVLHLLKHWRTGSIVSSTLRIAIAWAQWQSGHDRSIFEDVHTPLTYLECRWLRSTRDFMSHIDATIQFDQPLVASPERRHDVYIMRYAREIGLFNEKELAIINYCRIYLHLTTISELFDADGNSIIPSLFQCTREPWFNKTTYITLQQRPSEYHIRTKWQRLCRHWVSSSGEIAASIQLGPWTTPGHQLRRRRKSYITSEHTSIVYCWQDDCYWSYLPTEHPDQFRRGRQTTWEPISDCTPVIAIQTSADELRIQRPKSRIPPSSRPQTATSFENYVKLLDPWERDILHGIKFCLGPYEIHHHLSTLEGHPAVYMVSDGSVKDDDSSYGWVFGTDSGTILAEHSGQAYGTATSHRAEAWAMLSGTLFLKRLYCYIHNNKTPAPIPNPLIFFADNQGLITRILTRMKYQHSYPNSTLDPDWDLIDQIYDLVSSLPHNEIKHAWVKGHQDSYTSHLTTEAYYNVRADELASSYNWQSRRDSNPPWLLPAEKCRLSIKGKPVFGHYTYAIRQAAVLPPYFEYLRNRHSWSPNTHEQIDWQLMETASRTTFINQTQLCKLVHDKLPTRYELSKSNPYQVISCRNCNQPETFTHLLRCPGSEAQTFRDQLLDQVDSFFMRNDTPPRFRQLFLLSLPLWLEPAQSTPIEIQGLPACLQDQFTIGWDLFPRGFWSVEWRTQLDLAHRHHSDGTIPNTVAVLSGLIKLLWQNQIDYWTAHLQGKNGPSNGVTWKSMEKKEEYKARIRHLHQQRYACLHAHRLTYFHEDLESFLQQATTTQLRTYLHHYEPAIRASIREAQAIQTRPIFQFAGFSIRPRSTHRPGLTPTSLPIGHNSSNVPGGVPISRKHTRWRTSPLSLKSIRDYFRPNNPPS